MIFLNDVLVSPDIVDLVNLDVDVEYQFNDGMDEHKDYEHEEVSVVIVSNAIVKPDAVVVEVLAAAVASVTVLSELDYVSFTLVAVELVVIRVKR